MLIKVKSLAQITLLIFDGKLLIYSFNKISRFNFHLHFLSILAKCDFINQHSDQIVPLFICFFLFFVFLFLTLPLLQSKYSYKNISISICKILKNKLYFCKGRMTKKIHIFEWKHYGSSLTDYVSE